MALRPRPLLARTLSGRLGDNTDTSCSEDEAGWLRSSQLEKQVTPPPRKRLLSTGSNSASQSSPRASASPCGSQDRRVSDLRGSDHVSNELKIELDLMTESKLSSGCESILLQPGGASSPFSLGVPVATERELSGKHNLVRRCSQGHRPLTTGENRPSSPLSRLDKKAVARLGRRPNPYNRGGKYAARRESMLANSEGPDSPVPSSPNPSLSSLSSGVCPHSGAIMYPLPRVLGSCTVGRDSVSSDSITSGAGVGSSSDVNCGFQSGTDSVLGSGTGLDSGLDSDF